MTTLAESDLTEGKLWMLAQMSLGEDEAADRLQKDEGVEIVEHVEDTRIETTKTRLERPRSNSLPHPAKSSWSSFLTANPSLLEARPYNYKPLLSKGDFRLLSISKSGDDEQLYFQITRQRMEDCPPYEAVSYTWGSTERTEKIFHAFTGQILYITKNCASALQSLYTDSDRRFWIDAICINQDDIDERSIQVSMMADIFRNAVRTIAYVGESDEASRYLAARPTSRHNPHGQVRSAAIDTIEREESFDMFVSTRTEYSRVKAVASRPWFSRSWVIQEVLLSRNLVMQAGTDIMDFAEICAILQMHAKDHTKWVPGITNTFLRYGSENQVQSRLQKHFAVPGDLPLLSPGLPHKGYLKYWQLFSLLFETAPYQCRDARDKLFALISLFDGDPPEGLRPDYSLDVGEVYANISRYFIASEGITLGLCAATGVDSADNIPTWAIDWRDSPSTERDLRYDLGSRAQFSAGLLRNHRLSRGPDEHIPVLFSRGRVMRLRGLRVGTFSGIDVLTFRPKIDWSHHRMEVDRSESSQDWQFPQATQIDDAIVVFLGFEVPFVLRRSSESWRLVGECDIGDIMYGQALSELSLRWDEVDSDIPPSPLEDFALV